MAKESMFIASLILARHLQTYSSGFRDRFEGGEKNELFVKKRSSRGHAKPDTYPVFPG
jgi:hypothetical protein